MLDCLNHSLQLIVTFTCVIVLAAPVVSAKVTPLKTVDGAEIADFVRAQSTRVEKFTSAVSIPNPNVLLLQQLGIGRTFDEPFFLYIYFECSWGEIFLCEIYLSMMRSSRGSNSPKQLFDYGTPKYTLGR